MLNNKTGARQFYRFCVVGLANTAVDFMVFSILTMMGTAYLPAQVVSYSAGIVNSYLVNRKWTFRVTKQINLIESVKFIILNGMSLALSSGMLFILYNQNHYELWLCKAAATLISVVLNFTGSRIWVFAEKRPIAAQPVQVDQLMIPPEMDS